MVESKSPSWQRSDLRMTRLKEPDRGQLLIFKELEWQTVRIEAKSTKDEELTPLRLLTNQARCRITIKKRIAGNIASNNLLVIVVEVVMAVAMVAAAVVVVVVAMTVAMAVVFAMAMGAAPAAVAVEVLSVVVVVVQCKSLT